MDIIKNSGDAWSFIKKLADKSGSTTGLSDSDLMKLLKKSDKDGDGLITELEFKSGLFFSNQYKKLEEDFLNVFEIIAKSDGVSDSISDDDITEAIGTLQKLKNTSNVSSGDYSGGGSTNTISNNAQDNTVDRSSLEEKDVDSLQKSEINLLSQISSLRAEKQSSIKDVSKEVDIKKSDFDKVSNQFIDIVNLEDDTDEKSKESAQKVKDINNQKEEINRQVSDQEAVVEDSTLLIESLSSQLNGLVEPEKTISKTEIAEDGTEKVLTQANPQYDVYLQQKALLEEQLAQAEEQLSEQEEKLYELNIKLFEMEELYLSAIEEYCSVKESLGELSPQISEAEQMVKDKKIIYDNATRAKLEIEEKYQTQINKLQENLLVYNDVIRQKKLELPDGYSVVDNQIVGGQEDKKHTLMPVLKSEIPVDSQIDENGIIKDADENEIGRVFGKEDSEQIYIREPAPLSIDKINSYVDFLLNNKNVSRSDGNSSNDAELLEVSDVELDFTDVNSTDMAKIRNLYNERVKEKNIILNVEIPLKTFEERIEEIFAKDKKDVLQYIETAISRADANESSKVTFKKFLNEKGINILETSEFLINGYLNEFIEAETGAGYQVELTDSQIDNLVIGLFDGGLLNSQNITAREIFTNYKFDNIGPESIAKIIQKYDEKSKGNSEKTFLEIAEDIGIPLEQMNHITKGLLSTVSSNDDLLAKSSIDNLNKIIDNSIRKNDDSIINLIINSADDNLYEVQKVISDSQLLSKIDKLELDNQVVTELKNKLKEVCSRKYIPKNSQTFISDTRSESIYVNDGKYQYMLSHPENVNPNEELPLIVYLGGCNECKVGALGTLGYEDENGNGVQDDTENYKYNAIGTILSKTELDVPNAYIIAPSLTGTDIGGWPYFEESNEYVMNLINDFCKTHNVNPDKIYIGGHSRGAQGALYMTEKNPDFFAGGFILDGMAARWNQYHIEDNTTELIGFSSGFEYMQGSFKNKVGDENLVFLKNSEHGRLPVDVFNYDADGNNKADIFEWMVDDKKIK